MAQSSIFDFARRDVGGWTWMVRPSEGDSILEMILTDPDTVLALKADILKASASTTIGRFFRYVIKRWASEGVMGRLKDCVRTPRAERAARNALELAGAGIPTAAPVAWGAVKGWDMAAVSILIMENIPEAVHLGQWKGNRLPIIRRLGRLIGSLHQAGFTHGDLKPTNLLITPDGRPYLIDLDGLKRTRSLSSAGAVSDVIRLARRMVELSSLSPKEAAVFVVEYASARGARSPRAWWTSLKAEASRHHEFLPGNLSRR